MAEEQLESGFGEPELVSELPPTPGGPIEVVPPAHAFDVVRRGFSPEQVLQHLQRESDRVQDLELRLAKAAAELGEARQELESARRDRRDPMQGVSTHVLELVRGFDKEIERQRRMADLEATGMLADARTEAAKMRMDAQSESDRARGEAERLVRDAADEAARVRGELEELKASTLGEVREMRDRMRNAVGELDLILVDEPGDRAVIVLEEASDGPVPPPPRSSVPTAS